MLVAKYLLIRFLLVIVVVTGFCLGGPAPASQRAGPILLEDKMPQIVPNVPEPLGSLLPAPETRLISLLLKEFADPSEEQDEFAIRTGQKYKPEYFTDLIEDIKIHGLIDPPQVAKGPDGKWRIIAGHRRFAALWFLAKQGVPGFSPDMNVTVIEVQNAPHLNLLIRSIATNELGERLDVKERLVAVQKMDADHASKKEMGSALKVGEKSIERDLRITRSQRLFQHVMEDHLPPTAASALAEVAAKSNRLDEFLAYFDKFVARKQQEIKDEDQRSHQETCKGLKPHQMLVTSKLEPHVVRGWLEALAKNKSLREDADLGFVAVFDKKSAVATIKVKIDAKNDPVAHLARVASQISQVAKHLASFAQKRRALEAPQGPQAALQQDDSFLDLDLLRGFGLDDMVTQLEQELRPDAKSPCGELAEEGQEQPKEGEQ
jgi:ParB-like chromosome segregation protein Spo0J